MGGSIVVLMFTSGQGDTWCVIKSNIRSSVSKFVD